METVQLEQQGIGQEFNGYCCLYFVRYYYHLGFHCWCLQVDKKTCGVWDGVKLAPESKLQGAYVKTFPFLHNKTCLQQANEFLMDEFGFQIKIDGDCE